MSGECVGVARCRGRTVAEMLWPLCAAMQRVLMHGRTAETGSKVAAVEEKLWGGRQKIEELPTRELLGRRHAYALQRVHRTRGRGEGVNLRLRCVAGQGW